MFSLASEHAFDILVNMKTYCNKNSRERSLAAGERVLVLLQDINNSLLCNRKRPYTVLRKVNDTNYEANLGYRVIFLHINLCEMNERMRSRYMSSLLWKKGTLNNLSFH